MDINDVINDLSKERPIFHSEKDFQFALSWKIREMYEGLKIRLERPVYINSNKKIHLDIFIIDNKSLILIELKYKKHEINIEWDGEEFHLSEDKAKPPSRYDFASDIIRLEKCKENFKTEYKNILGYALFLTNESTYWKQPKKKDAVDREFRIHEGMLLRGKLSWGINTRGAMKNREEPLNLENSYAIHWKDYSNFEDKKNGQFRYTMVKVE